ncbi:MAG: hypothetical protein M8353_09970 [ANME-2 cluster archaeon]|nr:hypothetical protein [ANME-2 cluster archaeon]
MDTKDTKFILSLILQIPIWFTGVYWGIYWMFNWILGASAHPGESGLTRIGGTIICALLVYAIIWFIYGFLAYSFNLPKPFCKKT